MAPDRKDKQSNSIPIRFFDDDEERSASATQPQSSDFQEALTDEIEISEVDNAAKPKVDDSRLGGPELAELVASRAELNLLETELVEAEEGGAGSYSAVDD